MNVKVLKKALAVLEFVVMRLGRPVAPCEIAEALHLPKSTCARLVEDLCEAGYLAVAESRRGCVPGPATSWLGRHATFQKDFTEKAETLLRECADKEKISLLLVMRLGAGRMLLSGVNAAEKFRLDLLSPRRYDLYESATGVLLLAFAPGEEREEIFRSRGLPAGGVWGEAPSCAEIELKLCRIRREGIVRRDRIKLRLGAQRRSLRTRKV